SRRDRSSRRRRGTPSSGGLVRLIDDPAARAFRATLTEFLVEHAPVQPAPWVLQTGVDGIPPWAREWQAALFDHGWLVPENPPELGGRHATHDQVLIYLDEMIARGLPRSAHFPGYAIAAPTLLQFGSDDQRL